MLNSLVKSQGALIIFMVESTGFEEKAELAVNKMGKKQAKLYRQLRKAYQETGDDESLVKARLCLVNSKTSHLVIVRDCLGI